jgi:hypothetical protein
MPHHPARNQSLGVSTTRLFANLEASSFFGETGAACISRKVATQCVFSSVFCRGKSRRFSGSLQPVFGWFVGKALNKAKVCPTHDFGHGQQILRHVYNSFVCVPNSSGLKI